MAQAQATTIPDTPKNRAALDAMDRFVADPSPTTALEPLRILDEVLAEPRAYPVTFAQAILETIGSQHVEPGRSHLVRFLRTDHLCPEMRPLAWEAAIALGSLGGPGALEELSAFAARAPDDFVRTVPTAFRLLGDPRAVPELEKLAARDDLDLRGSVLAALAEFCATSSHSLAVAHTLDGNDGIRLGAVWWLSKCGTSDDAEHLVTALEDPAGLIRGHALEGLTRLEAEDACLLLPSLLHDADLSVRIAAAKYQRVCETR